MANSYLFEVAWEVCNQVGGIYTVIHSKIPSVISKWGSENYILMGPYFAHQAGPVFEAIEDYSDPIGKAVINMKKKGFDVKYGRWLVNGHPKVLLFNPECMYSRLGEIKYELWEHHHIATPGNDGLLDQVIAFGFQVKEFFKTLVGLNLLDKKIIAHFHEWMAGTPIPFLREANLPVKIVFTTHATLLGRYLAMDNPVFYDHLPHYNWAKEAHHFNVEYIVAIERAATHGAHVFSTVSDITAQECLHLLGRKPDIILPNGLNIQRFEAMHEFQNLHLKYKERIHEFTMGHFFQSYSFDLDKTLYFFTSGRFEYQNKGYDLTLEALARLNWKMKMANLDQTVIFFFITRQPFHSFNSEVLHSKALYEEIQRNTEAIQKQVAQRFFQQVVSENEGFKQPDMNKLAEEHLVLRLKRNVQTWKTKRLPTVCTHNLVHDGMDPIMNYLRMSGLTNHAYDKVKVIYHPDFINTANPLFRMEYHQFIRGCHMGVFPSYYEPWGYTPLECLASGIPTVTTDLAGFGSYCMEEIHDHEKKGIYVLKRNHRDFYAAAEDLALIMFRYIKMTRRERIAQRNNVEASADFFDWSRLGRQYDLAYKMALHRE